MVVYYEWPFMTKNGWMFFMHQDISRILLIGICTLSIRIGILPISIGKHPINIVRVQ
jgi:hypothetical protein